MPNELFIKIGGVFHFICALSHLIFPKMFKWEENLKELPSCKKIIIKQGLIISNICVALFWLIFGIRTKESWQRIIFFLAGFMFFLLPWLMEYVK